MSQARERCLQHGWIDRGYAIISSLSVYTGRHTQPQIIYTCNELGGLGEYFIRDESIIYNTFPILLSPSPLSPDLCSQTHQKDHPAARTVPSRAVSIYLTYFA